MRHFEQPTNIFLVNKVFLTKMTGIQLKVMAIEIPNGKYVCTTAMSFFIETGIISGLKSTNVPNTLVSSVHTTFFLS